MLDENFFKILVHLLTSSRNANKIPKNFLIYIKRILPKSHVPYEFKFIYLRLVLQKKLKSFINFNIEI